MERRELTKRLVVSPRLVPKQGKRRIHDVLVPSMTLDVSSTGYRSFVLAGQRINSRNPTDLSLGRAGNVSLDDARAKARDWLKLIAEGIDPRQAAKRQRAERESKEREEQRQSTSFGVVAKRYIQAHVRKLARAAGIESMIRREFLTRWEALPINELALAPDRIAKAFVEISERAPGLAQVAYGQLRHLFTWTMTSGEFPMVTVNPFDRLRAQTLVGSKVTRDRVLSEAELKAVWQATADHTIYNRIVRLLLLTGCRLREVSNLKWSEIDFDKGLIVIDGARMKTGIAHVVPITPLARELLESLPRFVGPYTFSARAGHSPFAGLQVAKDKLDAKLNFATPWVIHDLRRSARTYWSGITGIPDVVRELCLAHTQKGVAGVYDRFSYLSEKRQLLESWERMLLGFVDLKPPATVTDLATRRKKAA
jgi:integrase